MGKSNTFFPPIVEPGSPIQSSPIEEDDLHDMWSARRAIVFPEEKTIIAQYCVSHDFLVREGSNPATGIRKTVGSVLVNQGTTPNVVVREALEWIASNRDEGPFDITWYTPGALVPATLRAWRQEHPRMSSAAQLFLFPGRVDQQTDAVSGPEAVEFAHRLSRHFTYALLSSYSFDMATGTLYFHFSDEIDLQRACATAHAVSKFLFLDPSKFTIEGYPACALVDLLYTARVVTLYCVSSDMDGWIRASFDALCDRILSADPINGVDSGFSFDNKAVRLRIVGRGDSETKCLEHTGFLMQTVR